MYRNNRYVLVPLLLAIMVGCQPDRFLPVTTATSKPSLTLTVKAGRIFFIRDGNLWVMSPDGSQMHQLTTDEPPGIGYYISSDRSEVLVFASATKVALDTNRVQQVSLPEDCQVPRFPEHGNSKIFDFKFSSSGRYISFVVGNHECGESALRIFDRQTGTCSEVEGNDTLVKWLPDDRALVAMVRCEYGALSLYDPSTARERFLGYGSVGGWNQDQTTFYASVLDHIGWANVLWVYNLQIDKLVHQTLQPVSTDRPDYGRTEAAIGWTSDGAHLLYTGRQISYTYNLTSSLPSTIAFGPNQLYIVDSLGQLDRVLIDDPEHNYFPLDDEPLVIRRTPYQPFSISAGLVDQNALECPLYGRGCSDAEYFSLDWHTGALTPLIMLPTFSVTSVISAAAPDLNSQPIYSAADGSFALYTGNTGVGLWRVSAYGESVLMVADGHHFIYVEEQ